MNNLVTLMLILAGITLLLLRNGTKRQRRANRKLAITLLLVWYCEWRLHLYATTPANQLAASFN